MSIPLKIPRGRADAPPDDKPIVPPDDPNADRINRTPDIDPRPTDAPIEEPPDEPGTKQPPARACHGDDLPIDMRDWLMIGPFQPTCGVAVHTFAGAR